MTSFLQIFEDDAPEAAVAAAGAPGDGMDGDMGEDLMSLDLNLKKKKKKKKVCNAQAQPHTFRCCPAPAAWNLTPVQLPGSLVMWLPTHCVIYSSSVLALWSRNIHTLPHRNYSVSLSP